jgi:putative hydrolase
VAAGRGLAAIGSDTAHNNIDMGRNASGLDLNGKIAALLRDFAAVQKSKQSMWGYKRAAAAVLALDEPIASLLQPDGTLRKIPNIGPSSTRVILEILQTGSSSIIEQAISESGQTEDIARRRDLRGHFLSRAQVLAALRNTSLTGPTLKDYRGDLQMHSTWSDGSQTLQDIVSAGLALGYTFCGVTDHSYGLPIAHGMSMAQLLRQHAEMDRLNSEHRGQFRLIKGIEANIKSDGTLDMTPEELAQLEVVVAAPHSALRSTGDQTARMIGAVTTRGVHILGHPRGRKYGSRPGVSADWDRVFRAAAEADVAIEIDGDPSRQDVDYDLATRALDAGCLFALDSDAHSTRELRYAETAIAHARLAGIPTARIVNCWPVDRLLEWAGGRRTRGSARSPRGGSGRRRDRAS